MKVLITGGAGFIGSNFIHYWLKKYPQDTIVNLDVLTYAGNLDNLKDLKNNPYYRFVKGDICDAELVRKTMVGVDIVVHFAAESHVDRSILKPSRFIQTNLIGTHVLLEAAREKQIKRFHHISTDEVYGSLRLEDDYKFNESSPYKPRSPYAASKAAADHLVNSYYHTFGLPVTITNCSNNYGPYQHPEKLIPLTITNVLENKKVPVYGDGLHQRDWLYVEDHCLAIDAVLKKGKVGETYCVGGLTRNFSNIEIVKMIVKFLGKDESFIRQVKDRPGHDRKYAIDWSKINQELGWEPLHDLEDYLIRTIEWYKKNTVWWKRLKKGKFQDFYRQQYSDL